jgi:TolA-binding protein
MKAVARAIVALAIVFAGCSEPPAEEYMKKAEEAEKAGLWSVALENYQNLVRDHPGSVLAENASFNIAAIQHNNLQNFQAAVDGYKLFLAKYPDGKKAPTVLFLIGFLYHNELKNLDSAKAFYERFLAKYPSHEMAMSAQFELQNLGKSPDEILPKPTVAETAAPKSGGKASSKPKKN